MHDQANLSPLETLFETKHGRALRLTPNLTRLYGNLRMPQAHSRQHVFSNFVSTLDGVVSLQARGHAGGADIQDRMVMGLLRAIADVVIVGSGTLEADPQQVWTPNGICPELTDDYRPLRMALRKRAVPLNVIVSGSGQIDLRLPVFTSGRVQTLVVTTTVGAKHLLKRKTPRWLEIRAIPRCRGKIPPSSILDAVGRMNAGKRILIEGGPRGILCTAAGGRAISDLSSSNRWPRGWRRTTQSCDGSGVPAGQRAMGHSDRRSTRCQPPISAVYIPLHASAPELLNDYEAPQDADITKVQEWLGHANIAISRIYDLHKIKPSSSFAMRSESRGPPDPNAPFRPRPHRCFEETIAMTPLDPPRFGPRRRATRTPRASRRKTRPWAP